MNYIKILLSILFLVPPISLLIYATKQHLKLKNERKNIILLENELSILIEKSEKIEKQILERTYKRNTQIFKESDEKIKYQREYYKIPEEWHNSYFYKCLFEVNRKTDNYLWTINNVFYADIPSVPGHIFYSNDRIAAVCNMAKKVNNQGISLLLEDPETTPKWTAPSTSFSFSYALKELVGKTLILDVKKCKHDIIIENIVEIINYNKYGLTE